MVRTRMQPEYQEQECKHCKKTFRFKYQYKPRTYCSTFCAQRVSKKRMRDLEGRLWDKKYEKDNNFIL